MTGHIVLVEDDVVLSAVLKEVLSHRGYQVIIVGTLKGALGLIQTASAVIVDVDTTAADIELSRLSLLQGRRTSLPIVLLGVQIPETRTPPLSSQSGGLQSDYVVWLQKPFRNEDLLNAVRRGHVGCVSA